MPRIPHDELKSTLRKADEVFVYVRGGGNTGIFLKLTKEQARRLIEWDIATFLSPWGKYQFNYEIDGRDLWITGIGHRD